MRRKPRLFTIAAAIVAASLIVGGAIAAPLADISTGNVALFYQVYDAAHGTPGAEALQRDYIDRGSEGLRQFVPNRIISGAALAKTIIANPAVYEQARQCVAVLPAAKTRLAGAFRRLAAIDPAATFPPVTILIGRNNSGGTTGKAGVLIGLEVACGSSWLQKDLAARLYHLIAHEYGHVEQAPELDDDTKPTTVLKQSLIEGGAELIAVLISGEVSNIHLQAWTKGREREIGEAFVADADSTDISHWLYNGVGTPEHPGDLGYWVGYRILKAYYDKARDKRAALRTILALKDPKAILAASGWTPRR